MENETVCIDKKVLVDLSRMINEMSDRIESLELVSDPELMESLKKSKEEIANGEVADLDDL